MTLDPTVDPAQVMRARYVHTLRRIAELIEREALPVPSVRTSFSWYPHGDRDEQRAEAQQIAATLGGEWQADSPSSATYLHASAHLLGAQFGVGIDANVAVEREREREQAPPSVAFAAELNGAATGAHEALETLDDVAMTRDEALAVLHTVTITRDETVAPDLRACCDHEAHEPGECSVPGCDCDGDGPTVAVDR